MFWSMCRMAMGVGAFESPDPEAPSRYLKHILLSSRKFFRGLWSRRIHWKMRKSQIKFRNFEMNFWKILKKHLFPNFQADVCVLWTWEWMRLKALIQEHLLDTLNIYFWTLEKFLEASKGEESIQKMSKSQVKNSSGNFEIWLEICSFFEWILRL